MVTWISMERRNAEENDWMPVTHGINSSPVSSKSPVREGNEPPDHPKSSQLQRYGHGEDDQCVDPF
ncbi:unnamed protein product [Gadus morhua 'NCC']